jgi:hypothetical protein
VQVLILKNLRESRQCKIQLFRERREQTTQAKRGRLLKEKRQLEAGAAGPRRNDIQHYYITGSNCLSREIGVKTGESSGDDGQT